MIHVLRVEVPADINASQKAIDTLTEIFTREGGSLTDRRRGFQAGLERDPESGRVCGRASMPDKAAAKRAMAAIKAERGKSPLSQVEVKYHECRHDEHIPTPCVEHDDVPDDGATDA